MANIQPEITDFKSAVYGEEVRDALINLANKLNTEVSNAATTVGGYNTRLTNVENEIADIHTGYDETTYSSAGDAVRGQAEDIHVELTPIRQSGDLAAGLWESGSIDTSGADTSHATRCRTKGFITVPNDDRIEIVVKDGFRIAWVQYNQDETFISNAYWLSDDRSSFGIYQENGKKYRFAIDRVTSGLPITPSEASSAVSIRRIPACEDKVMHSLISGSIKTTNGANNNDAAIRLVRVRSNDSFIRFKNNFAKFEIFDDFVLYLYTYDSNKIFEEYSSPPISSGTKVLQVDPNKLYKIVVMRRDSGNLSIHDVYGRVRIYDCIEDVVGNINNNLEDEEKDRARTQNSGLTRLRDNQWTNGGVQTNPTNAEFGKIISQSYRVVMKDRVYAERPTTVTAGDGFLLCLCPYSSDSDASCIMHQAGFEAAVCYWEKIVYIPAGIWYRILIKRETENTSETADIAEFISTVRFSTAISDSVQWVDSIKDDRDSKSRYTWRLGKLDSIGGNYTEKKYLRMTDIAIAEHPIILDFDRSVINWAVFLYDDDNTYITNIIRAACIPSGTKFRIHVYPVDTSIAYIKSDVFDYMKMIEMPDNFLWRAAPHGSASIIGYVTANNRISTCDVIKADKPMKVWLDDYSQHKIYIYTYASSKINEIQKGQSWVQKDAYVPAGTIFRPLLSKVDNSEISDAELSETMALLHYEEIDDEAVAIDGLRRDVSALKVRVSKLESDPIPAYYEDDNYSIADRCSTILSLNPRGESGISQFVFLTDHHANSSGQQFHSKALMDYVFENTFCSMFVNGGDVVNGNQTATRQTPMEYTNQVRTYWNALIPDRCGLSLMVAGNHDTGAAWNPTIGCLIDQKTLFDNAPFGMVPGNVVYDPNCPMQYYVDDEYHKIRWIVCNWDNSVIGTWDETGTYGVAPESDINEYMFVANSLKTMKSGWTALLFNHIILHSTNMADRIGPIAHLCDSYNARAVETRHLNLTVDYSDAKGCVAAIIGGHSHFDYSYTSDGGTLIILTTTDNPEQQWVPDWEHSTAYRDPTIRDIGTPDEQAFDVFTLNTMTKSINATRIGYGEDRSWTYTGAM